MSSTKHHENEQRETNPGPCAGSPCTTESEARGADANDRDGRDRLNERVAGMWTGQRVIVESVETDQGGNVTYVRCGGRVEIIPPGGDVVAAMLEVLR